MAASQRVLPTVLVVDDDVLLLAAVKRSLGGERRILTAETLADARDHCASEALDVAIVDLRLDGECGIDLIVELARDRPHVRVALLTAHLDLDVTAKAARAGARVIALKPLPIRELLFVLETTGEPVTVLLGPERPHGLSSNGLEPICSLEEIDRGYARAVYERNGGNASKTARDLKISRSRIYNLLGEPSDD